MCIRDRPPPTPRRRLRMRGGNRRWSPLSTRTSRFDDKVMSRRRTGDNVDDDGRRSLCPAEDFYNQTQSEYKHVLANILRSLFVARTPSNKPAVQAAAVMLRTPPPSTANHRRPSHAHFPYTARNFENALRHPPVSGQRADPAQPAVRTMSSYRRMDESLKLGFALSCHSNATRAPIANPPNSAQLGGSLYHAAKLHPGP